MGGGGGGAVGLRLNIMTALYLPILGYAMATFDLDADALVLSSNNLKPHVVAESQRVAVGDQYEASIMFTLVNDSHASDDGHGSALFEPKIELDYSETPEGLQWDPAEQRLVMDTDKLFDDEPADTYTKEISFAGTIYGKTAKDQQQDRPPSYVESISGNFIAFRPTIQVQSNAVPKLYSNSRNSLSFTVPGVSATSLSLREKFSGQTFSGNSLTFSPSGDTTVIEVFRSSGEARSKLGEKGFKITKPPTPVVGLRQDGDQEFFSADSRVDLFTPFELVVRADETFASEYPQDAKYRIEEMRVEVTRQGLAPIGETFSRSDLQDKLDMSNAGEGEFIYNIDLFDVTNNPQGSGISVFVTGLSRINYQGQRVPINLDNVPSQFTYKSQ